MAESARIEELRRRVQLDPASIAFAALAEEYRRAGRFEEAVATCEAGLLRHPAYMSARVTLGRALLEMGRYDDARAELEHVLRASPENLAAIRGLAEIHHRTGETSEEEGEAYASAAVDAPPPPSPAVSHPPPPADDHAPIRVSAIDETPPAPPDAGEPETQSAPSESVFAQAPPPVVTPAPAPPDPEYAALPGLEEFLASIERVRATLPGSKGASRAPADTRPAADR